jgi:MFS family permease
MGSNESQPEFMTPTDPSIVSDVLPPSAEPARSTRGFWALIATQFQGAYSDNILRNLLLSMIVGMGMAENQRESFVSLVTLMFSVPFVLFSMPGGWLADRFSKREITIWTKAMEIASMGLATAGLATHRLPVSILALALVATQAALFGPSKYGLLPELLPAKRLSWGNGVIELGTFLAIIVGTVTGATMADSFRGREVYAGYALLALAFVGLLTSLGIDRVPAAAPTKKFRANIAGSRSS